jgi:microcystin degradation protein MlrC
MGMTFICITDNDPALAKEVANSVAKVAWDLREELQGGGTPVEAALVRASKATKFPVVLFDVGDNVGGGSPGDSTFVLHAARKLGISGVTQALYDPEVSALCHKLGVGAAITTEVGGKADTMHGAPFSITGKITSLTDGKYEEPKPTHGGTRFYNDGPSAAIETEDGFKILLITITNGSFSLEQFRSAGIDPVKEKIMVVKGVHSPRPAYEPVAAEMTWLSTAGVTTSDLSNFTYKHRRSPLYPFEPETQWK